MTEFNGTFYDPTSEPSVGVYVFSVIAILLVVCGGGIAITYLGVNGYISLGWGIAGTSLIAIGLAWAYMKTVDYVGNSIAWQDKLKKQS